MRDLQSQLRLKAGELGNQISQDPTIENIKAEISAILEQQAEGFRIRSKAAYLKDADKPTKFFLAREKTRGRKKEIIKLEKDGLTIREPEQIREECTRHYQNLLNEEPIDKSQWKALAENIVPLTEEQQLSCEGAITYRECWSAIKNMQDHKSPGIDGLSAEFYKHYFPLFGHLFMGILNRDTTGLLSETQRLGLITLLCKKKKTRRSA
jgi:hypothetical protein